MILTEKVTLVENEINGEKITEEVRSWEILSAKLPKEKNLPIWVRMSFVGGWFMVAMHQGADQFTAFPISFHQFLRLKWHRLWN